MAAHLLGILFAVAGQRVAQITDLEGNATLEARTLIDENVPVEKM